MFVTGLGFIKRHPASTFFAFTFLWSWTLWVSLIAFIPHIAKSQVASLLSLLGGASPSLMGIILTYVVGGKGSIRALFARLGQWQVNIAWYAVALLTTPLLSVSALAILMLLGIGVPTSDIASLVGQGFTWAIFASLGQELGWRGFALPTLHSRRNALVASLIIGVASGMWALPSTLIMMWPLRYQELFIPYFIVVRPILFTAFAILMTWVYNNTKGSMLLIVLFHVFFSACPAILTTPPSIRDDLRLNMIFSALFWLVAAIVVATAGTKRLVREPRQARVG